MSQQTSYPVSAKPDRADRMVPPVSVFSKQYASGGTSPKWACFLPPSSTINCLNLYHRGQTPVWTMTQSVCHNWYLPNLLSQPFNQTPHRNLSKLDLHAWLLEPQQSRRRVSLRPRQQELRLLKKDQPDQSLLTTG